MKREVDNYGQRGRKIVLQDTGRALRGVILVGRAGNTGLGQPYNTQ